MPAEGGAVDVGSTFAPRLRLTSSGFVPGRGHRDVARGGDRGGRHRGAAARPRADRCRARALAGELAERCRATGVLFVVNDRVGVAASVGAGAHVGQGDDPASGAGDPRARPRSSGSASRRPTRRARPRSSGADYLGVTVWATPTKPEAEPRGLDGLRTIAGATALPVVGIGGIDAENAAEVLDGGRGGDRGGVGGRRGARTRSRATRGAGGRRERVREEGKG